MMRLALFDCDGTLVDSQAVICVAMETAFSQSGLCAPRRSAIRRIVGLSLIEAVARLLPGEHARLHRQIASDYKIAFQTMRAEGRVDEPLFDGIADAIETLVARGWTLGIVTGKSDRGLAHLLEHHALTRHFATCQTADRHPSKPHPAMVAAAITEAGATTATTVVIGDTSFDMAMARAAGTRAIGVAWGYHPIAELNVAGAHGIAARAADLVPLLELP